MTDRRKPAHPKDCDCPLCVTGYVRGVATDRYRRDEADMQRFTCSRCAMLNKCDGYLRVFSLTHQLVASEYLNPHDLSLIDAMARACLKWRAK